jgi:hypothetical protein
MTATAMDQDGVMDTMEAAPPVFWDVPLTYEITPKSGPMRRLTTLADVRSAMVHDLPPGGTRRPHWLHAGMLIVAASESGDVNDVRVATDALIEALDIEGWLSVAPLQQP